MRKLLAIPALACGLLCFAQGSPEWNGPQNFFQQGDVPTGGHIGVHLHDIDADRAAMLKLPSVTGVEVVGVEPHGPADQAGIRAHDVLLSYNQEPITSAAQLGRLVGETPVGRKIRIEYSRDGKTLTTAVTTTPWSAQTIPSPNDFTMSRSEGFVIVGSIPTPHFTWVNSQFGIECEALDSDSSQLANYFGVKQGVLIRAVGKDSPAARAGLRAGDVLTQIADRSVSDPRQLASSMNQESRSARTISIVVMRDHKPTTLKLTLPAE